MLQFSLIRVGPFHYSKAFWYIRWTWNGLKHHLHLMSLLRLASPASVNYTTSIITVGELRSAFIYDPKCSTTFPWCTINAPAVFPRCTINTPAVFAWCTNQFVHKVEFSCIEWNGVHILWLCSIGKFARFYWKVRKVLVNPCIAHGRSCDMWATLSFCSGLWSDASVCWNSVYWCLSNMSGGQRWYSYMARFLLEVCAAPHFQRFWQEINGIAYPVWMGFMRCCTGLWNHNRLLCLAVPVTEPSTGQSLSHQLLCANVLDQSLTATCPIFPMGGYKVYQFAVPQNRTNMR